jgi:hypothetical protein
VDAEQLLAGVISQFSRRAACLRELVQNAIDADTDRIDVWFDKRDGYYRIAVEDYGCGMTLEQIDTYLLNVFRSSKEGDLEYIGRFGIGFVSVFAMEPEFVTVETSRDDEHTRIVIGKDLSIQYFTGEPRIGTRVGLHLKLPSDTAFNTLIAEGIAYLKHSCRFIDVELAVMRSEHADDHAETLLNEPFELALPMTASYLQDGTEIHVGYGAAPHYTLMNRRLVLEVGDRALVPGAVVLASSRDIEHNLARNAVIQDDHFSRFMTRLKGLAEKDLFPQLLTRAQKRLGGLATIRAIAAVLGEEPSELEKPYRALVDLPIFPMFVGSSGELKYRTLKDVLARKPIVSTRNSAFAHRVGQFQPVLLSASDWPVALILEQLVDEPLSTLDTYGGCVEAQGAVAESIVDLSLPLPERVERYIGAHLYGTAKDQLAVCVSERSSVWEGESVGPIVALNVRHPLTKRVLELGVRKPELMAQVLLSALEAECVVGRGAVDRAIDAWLDAAP